MAKSSYDLIADVGGTNTRLALSDEAGPVAASIRSYRNEAVGSFAAALGAFLKTTGKPPGGGLCVAVAGPVSSGRARLTNRDWHFEAGELMRISGAGQAVLLNDLAALGYALPHLRPDQTETLRSPGPNARTSNGQRLVLGLGTGANLAVSREAAPGIFAVFESEAGHAALPAPVAAALTDALGDRAKAFGTIEALFAGKGFSALHAARTCTEPRPAHELIDLPEAQATADLSARLLGLTLREIILTYMPLGGVYLAGGAARGLMGRARAAMLEALAQDHVLGDIIATPPVHLITDDAAALAGCAARLSQEPIAAG